MAHKVADRVRETSTTTGTGTLTLAGAVTGYQAMSAALTSNGDTGFFFATNGTSWEVFLGTRVTSTTLARTTVLASSNAGALVNWPAGSKDVVGDIPARYAELLNTIATTVASAATCDIGAVNGCMIDISGTTTITSFGTQPNKLRFVTFTGQLFLTHNATSLILPGSKNIVTTAGDTATFSSDASGNWRCRNYQPVGLWPYQVGTWTPVLQFGGLSTGITYGTQLGHYTVMGRMVFIQATISLTSKGTAVGVAQIAGLPYTPVFFAPLASWFRNVNTASPFRNAAMSNVGSAVILLYENDSTQMSDTSFQNITAIHVSGGYII